MKNSQEKKMRKKNEEKTAPKHKILYVEDNFQNFRLVMRMLYRDDHYEVIQAPDGESGLKMATDLKPDLILMDINLPDIDGEEVTQRIKANPALQHIPIVALTANAMVGDRERYLDAGCDDYMRKPLNRSDLIAILTHYLDEEKK